MICLNFNSINLHITLSVILMPRDWTGFTMTLLLLPCQQIAVHCQYETMKKTRLSLSLSHLQFVQKNKKLLLWFAQVMMWRLKSTFGNFSWDMRNAPKQLRKTVLTKQQKTKRNSLPPWLNNFWITVKQFIFN